MAETRIDQLTGLRVLLDTSGRATPPAGCSLCDPASSGLETVWTDAGGSVSAFAAPGDLDPGAGPDSSSDSGLSSIADPLRASTRGTDAGLFAAQPTAGANELIPHASEHGARLAGLGAERVAVLVAAWQARVAELSESSSYVSLSVDEGPGSHGHATLRSLDFVPAEVARERERSAAYHERTMGGHLLGDVVTAEIRRRERFVAVDDQSVLLCPWASRSAYELRIVPREPAPRWEIGAGAAPMLATAASLLEEALGPEAGLAVWVRTAPRGAEEFCWHIDLIPDPEGRDGFGLGTGVDVDRVAPEEAAERLRAIHAARTRAAREGG
ncbi:hypothetical protein HJD18_00880 [Thermoleophilia bacterium SCSIO 60948]|nr:hypothetical protein HJD18_00880 [Thermoleophilia bacterium SCSIO 60948]